MAGYQRHDFETTSVAPGSDGGWGAFARGFSNGHSIGKAVNSAINQHNISEANEQYKQDVENAESKHMAPTQAIPDDLIKEGTPEKAAVMTETQLSKLSPEAQEHFRKHYADQAAKGNTPEYRYDAQTRDSMIRDAAQRRDTAIKDSYLRWEGDAAYQNYKAQDMAVRGAEIDFKNEEARQNIIDGYKGDAWLTREGAVDRINNAAAYIGAVTGRNFGTFKVEDGKLYNDTGKGFQELPVAALNMVKRAAMADEIWDTTGNGADFSAAWKSIGDQEKLGLERQKLAILASKIQGGKSDKATSPMKDSDLVEFIDMGYKPSVDRNGNEFLVSEDGTVRIPTRRRFNTPQATQTNHAGQAIPTAAPKPKTAIDLPKNVMDNPGA